MGTAYLYGNGGSGGGSGGFGLHIVEGLVRPKNPTQGMIWAKTEHKVTYYDLSATKPENPVEGTLWVRIGDSSSNKIVSPVSKEWITVYPLSAEQYISGEWELIETMCYQDTEWVAWWDGTLFYNGDEYETYTGGWIDASTSASPTFKKENGKIYLYSNTTSGAAFAITKLPIDLTKFSMLTVTVDSMGSTGSGSSFSISVEPDEVYVQNSSIKRIGFTAPGEIELPIDGTDPGHICFGAYKGYIYVSKVKLSR